MYFFLQRWFLFFLAWIIMLQKELARFFGDPGGNFGWIFGRLLMSLYFFLFLISSMGIDKKANGMMICLSFGCVQKAAAVSIARSCGIDFWSKPNLCVLSSREGRDGEASWGGSSGCPANLASHLPFSSSLLAFFFHFKLWCCIVCQALLVVNRYTRATEVKRWVGHPGLNIMAAYACL